MEEERPTGQERQPTPGERARAFVDILVVLVVDILVGDWRPSERQVLQWIRIAVVVGSVLLVVLLILYVIGLLFGITLLNLLKVLAVPLTVGAAVPLLNWLQKKRELDVENQRAQDEALQAYLNYIGELLLKEKSLRVSKEDDEERILARARTLTVLGRLDARHSSSVMQFLGEASLIQTKNGKPPVIDLNGADLRDTNLRSAKLQGADLRRVNLNGAHLADSDLRGAKLSEATLVGADLRGSNLNRADMSHATITGGADLTDATLNSTVLRGADLSNAKLRRAFLELAVLSRAKLNGADMSHATLVAVDFTRADLTDAKVSQETLTRGAKSLRGATMPNGQKYED
jgi:uncharacterized protein YjbI with pentapeptide repeats